MSSPIPETAKILVGRAAARSRFARVLGFGAVLLGLGTVGIFLLQSGFFETLKPAQPTPVETIAHEGVLNGTGTKVTGYDDKNNPFAVTAQKALQDKGQSKLVHMEDVTGVLTRANGKPINVRSETALYNSDTRAMTLNGKVVVSQPGHYVAHMATADVDLKAQSLKSNQAVTVDIGGGTVEADMMDVLPGGDHVIFRGHVKTQYSSGILTGADKGDGG